MEATGLPIASSPTSSAASWPARPVRIRRPHSIRPWQHVLEPFHGYITLAEHLLSANPAPFATAYNFGPHDDDAREVAWIAEKMTAFWGDGARWILDEDPGVHEAGYLKLDASKATADLGWSPHLNLETALQWLVEWYRAWQSGTDMNSFTLNQIKKYDSLLGRKLTCQALSVLSHTIKTTYVYR